MGSRIEHLLASRGEHALTAVPLGPLPAYLAVDALGRPALAVPAPNAGLCQILETDYLTLRLFTSATITTLDGTQSDGTFHLMSCKKGGHEVNVPFEALAAGLAESLTTAEHADAELSVAFETLCELFRTKPSTDLGRARTGLWGELFFMREMSTYTQFASFWHTETGRKFDFSCGHCRVEIKATTGAQRSHTFAHGQLYAAGETEIVVGSLVLQYEDAGLSLAEMISDARAELFDHHGNLLKLEKAVRAAGMADTDDPGPTFDAAEAQAQMRFYRAQDVPHIPVAEPPGVFATTYSVSLGSSEPMPTVEAATWLASWKLA